MPPVPSDPASLARLTHHRWALPVLVELHNQRGSKFITLVNRLDAHRIAVTSALDALIELGLVIPNPGYGHPMRPEYILTTGGEQIAPACKRVMASLDRTGLTDLGLRKWTMPTILAVHQGAERFGQIRDALTSATDRAVSQCLSLSTDADLLRRNETEDDARAVVYALQRAGRIVGDALGGLTLA